MATRDTLCRLATAALMMWGMPAHAAPDTATCIAPAQPGGGFDLTCQLLADLLATKDIDVTHSFMPGGVGAVAFNTVVGRLRAEPSLLVAFSAGSVHNLALGAYGPHDLDDVQWLASLAVDYGAVTVRADAPWPDLQSLMDAARATPQRIAFGGGGAARGQDHMRAEIMGQLAGLARGSLRFVAFEGGGGCTEALVAGFVQACLNDVGDSQTAIEEGAPLRILAVHAPHRLQGDMARIPTAREQGLPLDWPVMRGVYTGPDVPARDVAAWRALLDGLMATPAYAALLERHHLQPLPLTGPALDARLIDLAARARAYAPHGSAER